MSVFRRNVEVPTKYAEKTCFEMGPKKIKKLKDRTTPRIEK